MPVTTVDLLRHGEAAPGLCLGARHDVPLTGTGWSQMRAVLGEAKQTPWDGVACSPLLRCAAFAAELAGHFGLPLKSEPRFRELGFGTWEGRSWSALYGQEGERLLNFQRDPLCRGGWSPAPEGEHYADFEARVAGGWADLLATARGRRWLLVTHAGVLRAILRLILAFPPDRLFAIQVPLACLTRIEQKGEELPRLIFHGGRL